MFIILGLLFDKTRILLGTGLETTNIQKFNQYESEIFREMRVYTNSAEFTLLPKKQFKEVLSKSIDLLKIYNITILYTYKDIYQTKDTEYNTKKIKFLYNYINRKYFFASSYTLYLSMGCQKMVIFIKNGTRNVILTGYPEGFIFYQNEVELIKVRGPQKNTLLYQSKLIDFITINIVERNIE